MSEDLKPTGEALPKELQSLITTYEGASDDNWIEWSKEWDLETTRLIRNTAVAMLQLGEESRKAKRKEGIDLHNDGSPQSVLTAPLFFLSEAALKRIESGLNQVTT